MADAQQEIAKLQEQIHKGAEETKTYLETLKAKLGEYDEHYKVSETATSFLQASIDRAHKSVDELKELGDKLKQKGSNGKETVVETTKASLDKVHAALEGLKQSGREYDQRFKSRLSTSYESAKGGIGAATSTVSHSIETIVTSTREKTASSFEQIKEQVAKVQLAIGNKTAEVGHSALVAAGGVVSMAEELDEKFGVRSTITVAVTAVTEKVADLDKSLGVSETALKMDEKVSGGIGANLIHKGVEFVNTSVEYVAGALSSAKEAAATDTAQKNGGRHGADASVSSCSESAGTATTSATTADASSEPPTKTVA